MKKMWEEGVDWRNEACWRCEAAESSVETVHALGNETTSLPTEERATSSDSSLRRDVPSSKCFWY